MKVTGCGASHRGNLRAHNEDNLFVNGAYRKDVTVDNTLFREIREQGPFTYAVFDGLGGGDKGEIASLIAAERLAAADSYGLNGRMDSYILDAHNSIADYSRKEKLYEMGTTIAMVNISGSAAQVCNIGDSRVYLWRSGRLTQLSHDHNVKQSMIDSGIITAEDARKTNRGGELTQYLGIITEDDMEPEAYFTDIRLMNGDVILLCSDGLTNELDEDDIAETIEKNRDRGAERTAVTLVWKAVQGACRDNVTAVAICITE